MPYPIVSPKYRREATIVIAAHDSKDKKNADYACTGTNDDLTIESAINELTSGGRIILLEGTYNLGSTLDINVANITLEGQGNATVIKVNGGFNGISVSADNVKLKEFKIDCANQTSGDALNISGSFTVVSKLFIYKSYRYGIYTSKGPNIIIDNILRDSRNHAIYLVNSNYSFVSGNYIYTTLGGYGIVLSSSNNTLVNNNYIYDTQGDGMYIYASYNTEIVGNKLHTPGMDGIAIASSDFISVTGNNIYGGNTAINFYNSRYSCASGNLVYNVNVDGIRFSGYSHYSIACGNKIRTTKQHGINVKSNFCTITGNNIDNVYSGYYGIYVTGGECIISSNYSTSEIYSSGSKTIIIGNKAPSITCTGSNSYILGNTVNSVSQSQTSISDIGNGFNNIYFRFNTSAFV